MTTRTDDYTFALSWGEDSDGDSFVTLFGYITGYVLKVNGRDVWLMGTDLDDDGIPGLKLRPFIPAGPIDGEPDDEYFIGWIDLESVVIH